MPRIDARRIGGIDRKIGAWPGSVAIDLDAIRAASATRRVPASQALELDPTKYRARKSAPLALDLSGIAKGSAVDRLAETSGQLGITQALSTIDGEVRAIGPGGPGVLGRWGRHAGR